MGKMPSKLNDIIFDFSLIGRVILQRSAYRKLLEFCQDSHNDEKGGIILGVYRLKDGVWIVKKIMQPSVRNRSGKTWLIRDYKDAQAYIDRLFIESGGVLNYLGDWHTHPDKDPTPSQLDMETLKAVLKHSKSEINFLIGIILGQTGNLCVWCLNKQGQNEIIHYDIEPSM